MRYLAVDEAPSLPRLVRADVDMFAATQQAIVPWNTIRPDTFRMVAWHERADVGIDLNAEYLEMAKRRCAQMALELAPTDGGVA